MGSPRKKVLAAAAAGALLLGAGAAVASTGVFDPKKTSQEIIDDAAKELGVGSDELEDALQQAVIARIDAAVEAGDLSEDRAAELEDAIENGDLPLFGGLGHHGPGGPWGPGPEGAVLPEAAADYLGLTAQQVRSRLMNGKTLADIAEQQGKSVDGLVGVLVEAKKTRLQHAVDDGRLTEEQRDPILEDLDERIRDLVENGMPHHPHGPRHGPHGDGPGW